jgi:hypothetical protein
VLHDEGAQALRRRVHRGRKAGRPGADDEDVERPGLVERGGNVVTVRGEVLT